MMAGGAEPKRWGRLKESLGHGRSRWLLLITPPGVSVERNLITFKFRLQKMSKHE